MALIHNHLAQERLTALVEELKRVRYWRGDLPQEVLAARLNVATHSVADWEAGRDNPSAPHLMAWSRELGLRVAITDSDGNEIPVAPDTDTACEEPYPQRELRRLSTALRTARMRRRLTQASLAAKLGVNQRSITRWERAEGYPRPIGFVLWARALECNVRLLPT
ncbi:helix-turn-helix domain-containing protein [Actinocrinis puniceicyclus]|uniref:Helix-turn-helix domain-containing protein n=1 Tax=Actinocrinis puniceicyclus TaxID=977794 RepID=A0A8J7WUD4_9ACTN|nr:helix-turn-helix domain-containing protein [Actinocrinis puniceicyclus]MBS2966642.1 helix-turn-helix domain-containing protein [Actinocrinis puniceicyclus]